MMMIYSNSTFVAALGLGKFDLLGKFSLVQFLCTWWNKIRDLFKVKLYAIRSGTKKKRDRKKREREKKEREKKREKKKRERERKERERKKKRETLNIY